MKALKEAKRINKLIRGREGIFWGVSHEGKSEEMVHTVENVRLDKKNKVAPMKKKGKTYEIDIYQCR